MAKLLKNPTNVPSWIVGASDPNVRASNQAANSARTNMGRMGVAPVSMTPGALGELCDSPLEALPSSMPATRTYQLPLSQAAAKEAFPAEWAVTSIATQGQGIVGKWIATSSPNAPFFARGICIVGRVDPYSYSLTGASITPPSTGGNSPLIPPVVPVGGLPVIGAAGAVTTDLAARPATFSYGASAWRAFVNLLQSYQFQYLLQGRYLMVNERSIDIGVIDSQWDFRGFGLAQIDPSSDIQEANQHFKNGLGADRIFSLPNISSLGDATAVPPVKGTGLAPQLADVQWGGPHAPGVFGCCMPLRPHVLFPGQNYQFLFVQNDDELYHDRLLGDVTIRDFTSADPLFHESIPSSTAVFNSKTMNTDPVYIGSIPFEYGTLQIGIMVRGAEILPTSTIEWLLMYGQPYMSMVASNQTAFNYVQDMARQVNLAGVPRPLTKNDPRLAQYGAALGALGSVEDGEFVLSASGSTQERLAAMKALTDDSATGHFVNFAQLQAAYAGA
jgi:hypothetical protein